MTETGRGGIGAAGVHPGDDALLDLAFELLPPERRAGILAHLADCRECETAYREIVTEQERGRARFAGPVGAAHASRSPAHRPGGRPATRRRGVWIGAGAIAASLVVVLVLARAPHPKLDPVWMPGSGAGTESRGSGGDPRDVAVRDGLHRYQGHDLDGAIRALSGVEAADPTLESDRRIHLASALVLAGRPHDALRVLEGVDIDALPFPWRGETRWVRACALARTGRGNEARAELERLAREAGDAGERARASLATWPR